MACTPQSSQWDAYSQCLLDCTCGVSDLNYMDYCRNRFVMNVTAHDLCLCLTTRCMVRCFREAGCGELSGCLALEQQMPCNINCARAGASEPSKRWEWSLTEWPCISSLEPAEATTILEAQGSNTTMIVTIGVACFAAVIIMFICCCTCRYLRKGRAEMEADMQGRA